MTAGDGTVAQTTPDRIEPRVLIINATPGSQGGDTGGNGDGAADAGAAGAATAGAGASGGSGGGRMKGGYVGLMNCVFAAQKAVSPTPSLLESGPGLYLDLWRLGIGTRYGSDPRKPG